MYKLCKKCKERMMIVQEGIPQYTCGSYIIYGCPSCGYLEYSYDKTDINDINPIKSIFDPKDVSQYYVSN